MRSATIFLLVALVAGASGYYYWSNYQSKPEPALLYLPKNSQLIFVSKNTAALEQLLEDSNSFFNSSLTVSKFAQAITSFIKPLHENKDSVFIACSVASEGTEITVVFKPDDATKNLGVETSTGQWRLLTNYEPTVSPINDRLNADLVHALKSLNASTGVLIKPEILSDVLKHLIDETYTKAIISELQSSEWLGFGLNLDYPFVTSAITRSAKTSTDCQLASSILLKLPLRTNACFSTCADDVVTAMVHIPYSSSPDGWSDNVFIIQSSDKLDTTKYPLHEPISVNREAVPIPMQDWNDETIIAMNLGNELVFASNANHLGKFYQDYKSYNLLPKTAAFQKLKTSLSDASMCLYLSGLTNYEQPNPAHFEDTAFINAFLFQANTEISGTEHFTFAALYNESTQSALQHQWRTQLDAAITGGPWEFTNHYTRETEILVQDENKQLYLINKEGKTLWKKRLNGHINQQALMVDAFASGKNQILFTTNGSLHLIDRNGNDVEGFPVKLTKETTVPPIAVRYSDKGELRILACDGSILRNFQADGQPVDGWKNPDISSNPNSKPYYLNRAGKDYFMILNSNNKLHVFDRTGNTKRQPIDFPEHAQYAELSFGKSFGESNIIGFDTAGHLYKRPFDGALSEQNILPTGKILFTTTQSKSVKCLVYQDGRLFGLDDENNAVIDLLLPTKNISALKWLDEDQSLLGLYNAQDRKLIIVNTTESEIITSSLPSDLHCIYIDLDQDGTRELIVHNGQGEISAITDI